MPPTILLADDSLTIQRVIELTFADEGIQVVSVGDGDEAVVELDRTTPDVVLADATMPGRSGYDVAEHIRKTPRLAHIPVLLLTGAVGPVDSGRAAAVGCDGVLAKPFDPQVLIERVKELLVRQKRPGEGTEVSRESASQPPSPHPPTADDSKPQTDPAGVADYFDRLDRAFGALGMTTAASGAAAILPTEDRSQGTAEADDSIRVAPGRPSALSYGSPRSDFDRAGGSGPESNDAAAPSSRPSAPAPGPTPQLAPAAAFAALLAAEQGAASLALARTQVKTAPRSIVTEELIDELARRVLERLSDHVGGEAVTDVVVTVAERLVAAEIERIRGSID